MAGARGRSRGAGNFVGQAKCLAAVALFCGVAVVGCDVQIGSDEQARTVTEASPTVTERKIIKKPPRATTQPTEDQSLGGSVTDAAARVRSDGFTVEDTGTYDDSYALRVLIGTREGSATGFAQRAFFFVGGDYIGTDTSADSAHVEYAGQDDETVSLSYDLYRRNDPNCCPTGGEATVTYQLNEDRQSLTPLDEIPSDSASARLSRR